MFSMTVSQSLIRNHPLRFLLIVLAIVSFLQNHCLGHQIRTDGDVGRRKLLGFKETPGGTNFTFECSPSGPCVPCQYSEKNDYKYRCSETGYRIPFKCVKTGNVSKEASGKRPENSRSTMEGYSANAENSVVKHRSLTDKVSSQEATSQPYVTYRSCIQSVNEEKFSVLGFEVLMLAMLLASGSFVMFRRRRTIAMAGVGGGVRMQTNPRL